MLSSDSDITNLKEFVKAKSLNNQKGLPHDCSTKTLLFVTTKTEYMESWTEMGQGVNHFIYY